MSGILSETGWENLFLAGGSGSRLGRQTACAHLVEQRTSKETKGRGARGADVSRR
ncbi:uncharacterized protein PGTG_21920 [Puccinia graminis f. sp. tritici CRL 75-36-700-3]|uniref:Uncharacterized protein n=1 Tax=Puccinia graminis f. sp. tritici (strain CRL 75-36-700-3 / race SCCL) TaxID=418459 RepID=H6QT03_PUCGT|nr:uncharacterized protein PGTG_22626 [Puccinia graminis f. sp. tritici CRL 75-36-700-3]XP_003889363.1 uncharacterized protein PGTG_21920 [Puccinia graminis f. sp. tritici CRL 75-36-700-3]EHS62718.1 hypothetical protein PGTG_22626 [Puccinia graminis f. sp. tritici CRL 75-36-700-3]EHS63966.1 hypothetical protein PGTG_21920 [Puccinia graminis f. sp. tritici CRL 75-36-700-3]